MRLLGAETFGAYVSLITIGGLLTVATSIGLPALVQREISASRGSGDRSALKPLVQGLVIVNGTLLLALFGAGITGATETAAVLVFCLAGNMAGILGSLFVAYERVLVAQWVGNVLRPAIALLALIVFASMMAHSELVPLYAQITGATLAAFALLVLWQGEPLSKASQALRTAWWSDQHNAVLRSGLIFAGTQVLINLTTQIDILILTAMAKPEDVAHYFAAVRAALVISFFFGASGMLAEPTLTRLFAAGENVAVQELATRTAIAGSAITLLAAAAAVVIAPYYLAFYGAEFLVAFPSFCVFAAGLVVCSMFGPAQPLLRATRSDKALLILTAGALALNGLITAALVPFLGILGAAIGLGLQFAVYGMMLAWVLWQRTNVRSDVFAVVAAFNK